MKRCDQLAKLYLWLISNNQDAEAQLRSFVVISLQNCIFGLLATTLSISTIDYISCDQLAKLYLWLISNNDDRKNDFKYWVVISLQNCIFGLLATTFRRRVLLSFSCDQLAKLYLWLISNNTRQ